MRRLAAVWGAATARVSRFLATPFWRRTKLLADGVLLAAVMAAIGWAATNGVFVAQRAATNRAQVVVHLSGAPSVRPAGLSGKVPTSSAPPTVVLAGSRSARVTIGIANDGVDGMTVKGATLTGPFLTGSVQLKLSSRTDYVAGTSTAALVGTVTVDCDAASAVSHALVAGQQGPAQQATNVVVSVKDTDGTVHSITLFLDSTAFAIQGRVCTR